MSAPDTGGRYYLLPMLDMWTDVFASPGWRTTGTQAGNYLVVPPGWSGALPAGVDAHRRADALCLDHRPHQDRWPGRLRRGPQDPGRLQDHAAVAMGQDAPSRSAATIDPAVDMKTPPKIRSIPCRPDKFFAYAAEILEDQPPHITDQPIIAQMKRIGIEPGKSFDIDKARPGDQGRLATAPQDAQKLMAWKVPPIARVVNGWSMNTDTMGVYGNYYLKRAIVAQFGLGANLPEDAIYPHEPRRRGRQAARRRQQLHAPLRQGRARRRSTPSGRSRSTTARASRWRTRSIGSPSAAGCRSNTTPTARSISISRTKVPARTRKRTGFPRRRAHST